LLLLRERDALRHLLPRAEAGALRLSGGDDVNDEALREHLSRIYGALEECAGGLTELTACVRDGEINPSTGPELRVIGAIVAEGRAALAADAKPAAPEAVAEAAPMTPFPPAVAALVEAAVAFDKAKTEYGAAFDRWRADEPAEYTARFETPGGVAGDNPPGFRRIVYPAMDLLREARFALEEACHAVAGETKP
jgi:hypothetical protein